MITRASFATTAACVPRMAPIEAPQDWPGRKVVVRSGSDQKHRQDPRAGLALAHFPTFRTSAPPEDSPRAQEDLPEMSLFVSERRMNEWRPSADRPQTAEHRLETEWK